MHQFCIFLSDGSGKKKLTGLSSIAFQLRIGKRGHLLDTGTGREHAGTPGGSNRFFYLLADVLSSLQKKKYRTLKEI